RTASAVAVSTELRAIAATGGLGDPTEELSAYFTDPEAFVRGHSPKIVSATITSAQRAATDGKLPRALALADRASALAPHDPAVVALIDTLAAGGRSRSRRRLVGLAALALAMSGAGAAVAFTALGGGGENAPDAGAVALADADTAVATTTIDAATESTIDAAIGPVSTPDAAAAVTADAPITPIARDAGVARRKDAGGSVALTTDAGVTPIDAAVIAVDAAALSSGTGAIIVKNDTWCEVEIDGEPRGRISARPIKVSAGPHTVVCTQGSGTGMIWTKQVEVGPGELRTVTGSLLAYNEVRISTDVTIAGIAYRAGMTVKLKGRVELEKDGAKIFVTISSPCEIRDKPDLNCYR
ncbi:MAG: hypothetical protein H0T42_31550, partial [Deltaproteobacteria bacterium]|nr:hypothetical protein [Deltaproteobacteria bacterium]